MCPRPKHCLPGGRTPRNSGGSMRPRPQPRPQGLLHFSKSVIFPTLFIVVLWRKSRLSYLSHFKTYTSSLYEKKNAVCYFYISLFVPEIFKFLKYAHKLSDDVINSTGFWSNMMNKDTSANLNQKYLILESMILLEMLHNINLALLLPWQHTYCAILIFANGSLSAWSTKLINKLVRVHGLV